MQARLVISMLHPVWYTVFGYIDVTRCMVHCVWLYRCYTLYGALCLLISMLHLVWYTVFGYIDVTPYMVHCIWLYRCYTLYGTLCLVISMLHPVWYTVFGYIDVTRCIVHCVWLYQCYTLYGTLCLVISMLHPVWYTVFGSNLCQNTNYSDWNFRANDQSFQINAAIAPQIRRRPLHSPSLPLPSSNPALRSLSYSHSNHVNYRQIKDRISQNKEHSNLYTLLVWRKRSQRLTMNCTVRGSKSGDSVSFRTHPYRPWGPLCLL